MTSFELPAVVLRDVLKDRLPGDTVYITVPRDHASSYVHILSRGGTRQANGQLSSRQMQLLAYGPSSGVAADLCERAVSALVAAGKDPAVKRLRRCTVAAEPADYADPDTGAPRATATVVVLLRATTP